MPSEIPNTGIAERMERWSDDDLSYLSTRLADPALRQLARDILKKRCEHHFCLGTWPGEVSSRCCKCGTPSGEVNQ